MLNERAGVDARSYIHEGFDYSWSGRSPFVCTIDYI